MRIYKLVGIVLSALLLLASCADSGPNKKKVKIADVALKEFGVTLIFD